MWKFSRNIPHRLYKQLWNKNINSVSAHIVHYTIYGEALASTDMDAGLNIVRTMFVTVIDYFKMNE